MSRAPTILDGRGRPARRSYSGGYLAAGYSQSRSIIPGYVTDSRSELTGYTRYELLRKARFMDKNVGMIRGVKKSLVDNVVGPGIYPLPATRDDAWNAAAWSWFWEHAKIGDVSGRMTLWEAQRVRTAAKFVDGEMFTVHVRSAAGWPQFQLVRAHCCGSFGLQEEDGWTDGVKVDGANRAKAYRFRLRGDDSYANIPAANVVHSYLLESSDQVRGVTPLAHAINHLHDILDLLSMEMDAVKDNSRISRVIENESGETEGEGSHFDDLGSSDDIAEAVRLERVFGAEILRLRRGEKLHSHTSDRPSPTFVGFIDWLGKMVTNGTAYPYEFAWNPNELKGPGVRLVLEKVRLANQEWRSNEIEDTFPFYTFSIATAIETGELPYNPEWFKVEWIGGAEDVTIDKAKDAVQDRENIKTALDTFKRYYARRGLWWKTELEQKAKEAGFIEDLAKKYGVSTDKIHLLLVNGSRDPGADAAAEVAKREIEEADKAA